ncbi:MAG: hypothetical protein IPL61_34405 [Myxococcales bacterium]|nr:hypothetical protein [Myxococcales bacterium]
MRARLDPVWANVARGRDRAPFVDGRSVDRRVTIGDVRAALVVVIATLALAGFASAVRADAIDDEARQLASAPGYKRRLAAVLALSKSHDARAVRALVDGLRRDQEVQIRRVAALALGKSVDASTPGAARDLALAALTEAGKESDRKVRELAARSREIIAALARSAPVGDAPAVYVHLGVGVDLSSKAPRDAVERLVKTVRVTVARRAPGVATEWPGRPPTEQQLTAAGSRGFLVAPTISALAVQKRGNQAEITCTVSVRVAPWAGVDGAEKWAAQRAASASGSAKAITSTDPASIASGMRDCVMAVAEEVTAKQVVPFLRKLIGSS